MQGNKLKRLTVVRQRYRLISFRDIDNQRILEPDSPKSTHGHTQPRVVGIDATFL